MNVEELIALVRSRSEIYDAKHPKHWDKEYISGVWKSIADELHATEKETRKKWQNLRSNYMREKRKFSTALLGSPIDAKISWPYYTMMSFLDNSPSHKKSMGNIYDISPSNVMEGESQQSIEDISEVDRKRGSQENVEELTVEVEHFEVENTKDVSFDSVSRKRKRTSSSGQDATEKMYLNMLEKLVSRSQEENDPDFMFLKSLLPYIRQLGPLENLDFKEEVIQLLRQKLMSPSPV